LGIFLLVIFVVGSLALSVRAWRSDNTAIRPEPDGPIDKPALIIRTVAVALCSFLPELLAHYTKSSFHIRVVIAGAATLLFQLFAFRVLSGVRQEVQDGPEARHHTS